MNSHITLSTLHLILYGYFFAAYGECKTPLAIHFVGNQKKESFSTVYSRSVRRRLTLFVRIWLVSFALIFVGFFSLRGKFAVCAVFVIDKLEILLNRNPFVENFIAHSSKHMK